MLRILLPVLFIFAVNHVSAEEQSIAIKIVTEKCQHCHGMQGEGSSMIYPRLAAQHKDYIVKQLKDFKSGSRKGTMNEIAAVLNEEEITITNGKITIIQNTINTK